MITAPQLLTIYQQLLELSQTMLRLAAEGQWDDLIAKEMEYVSAVQKLARATQEAQPPSHIQEQLRPVLRHVLENEREVKALLQARMNELAKLLGQNSRQKSVLAAYTRQGGNVLLPNDSSEANQ
ncbi:flagella biosynthesis regulatory protein FliT [Franconibacter helveticus]|uniref:flagella biosynthesis regulatory protein FliT n=1 Tax=Franconibacter helveticus TaxID=357240 RepID=UPI00066C9A77|nr:flagella biosynthesis regulatory protein FliT [Franconibacter helveticus]MDU6923566.1 flagella biosynthesis regulatory protein FliT [Franconibacter helveticus]